MEKRTTEVAWLSLKVAHSTVSAAGYSRRRQHSEERKQAEGRKLMLSMCFVKVQNYSVHIENRMFNLSGSINDPRFDSLKQPIFQIFIVVLYAFVILTGVLGNGIVVFAVFRHRNLQTATSVFIASLAFSDVGLCAFNLPLQLHYQLTDNWSFGETLCRAIFAGFAIPMYVSTLTILLIAYDRYRQIVYPLRDGLTFRTALALVAVSLVGSVLLSTPIVFFTSVLDLSDPDLDIDRHYCVETWPNVEARISYGVATFAFQFCVPLLVSFVLYHRIYVRLKTRRRRQRHAHRHNTNRILIAIVALFLVCWSPWNLFSLVTEIDYGLVRGPNFKATDLLLKAIALGSSCVNPFLYCWLNANFRAELQAVASRLRINGRSTPRTSNCRSFQRPLEDFASVSCGVATADARSYRPSVVNRPEVFSQPWNALSTGGDRIRDRATVAMTTVTAVVERGQSAV